MVAQKEITRYVDELARKFAPDRVVLFGSHAKGDADKDSDVDLLVIMRHNTRNVKKAIEISRDIKRSFPLDLLVRKPGEVRHRLKERDVFLRSIMEEGKTLYDRRA